MEASPRLPVLCHLTGCLSLPTSSNTGSLKVDCDSPLCTPLMIQRVSHTTGFRLVLSMLSNGYSIMLRERAWAAHSRCFILSPLPEATFPRTVCPPGLHSPPAPSTHRRHFLNILESEQFAFDSQLCHLFTVSPWVNDSVYIFIHTSENGEQ